MVYTPDRIAQKLYQIYRQIRNQIFSVLKKMPKMRRAMLLPNQNSQGKS